MTSKFSAFDDSPAFVKLKLPVMTTALSIRMILFWAMACFASMNVAMPAREMKSASE